MRVALVLLVSGPLLIIAALAWTALSSSDRDRPQAIPTTVPSSVAVTRTVATRPSASPSPGETARPTPTSQDVTVEPSPVGAPSTVPMPSQGLSTSDIAALITALSGLLASVAGLITALVSLRAARR
jgi:hypothetical protein